VCLRLVVRRGSRPNLLSLVVAMRSPRLEGRADRCIEVETPSRRRRLEVQLYRSTPNRKLRNRRRSALKAVLARLETQFHFR